MKKVLIVDDSRFILAILEDAILKVADVSIVTASSFNEAQALVEKEHFHLAVLDVHLPDAQNGEVIDLLLAEDVPVIVLTGMMNSVTKEIILQKPIVDYVTKSDPESIVYVALIVRQILSRYEMNALVVDDSKTSRILNVLLLQELHLNVLEVSSAKGAIELIESGKVKIDLVLTDYEMPEMDGMELTLYLRQKYSKDRLSIIAVSGREDDEVYIQFLRHGVNDFIKKPFSNEEFLSRVSNNLELIELFKLSRAKN